MGSWSQFFREKWNNFFKDEEEERKERERKEREEREREEVKKDILRFGGKMEVKARAHYFCADYYAKWKFFLFVPLLIVGGALVGYQQEVDGRPLKTGKVIFVLAVAVFVIERIYRWATDSHEKHYKAETNCQSIAERALSLRKRACDCTESTSSLRDRLDKLLEAKGNSSEIRPEEWAIQKASKK